MTYNSSLGPYYQYSGAPPHAVTHLSATSGGAGTQKFWYDDSGNMTTRIIGSATYAQTWDEENQLASVTDQTAGEITTFVYDGDGLLVRKDDASGMTLYLGQQYEVHLPAPVSGQGSALSAQGGGGTASLEEDACPARPEAAGCEAWVVRPKGSGEEGALERPMAPAPELPGSAPEGRQAGSLPDAEGRQPRAAARGEGLGLPDAGFEEGTGWTEVTHQDFPGTSFYRCDWGGTGGHGGTGYAYLLSNQEPGLRPPGVGGDAGAEPGLVSDRTEIRMEGITPAELTEDQAPSRTGKPSAPSPADTGSIPRTRRTLRTYLAGSEYLLQKARAERRTRFLRRRSWLRSRAHFRNS